MKRELTIFENGGYSLRRLRPGAGWEMECAVFHPLKKSDTDEMITACKKHDITIEDQRVDQE